MLARSHAHLVKRPLRRAHELDELLARALAAQLVNARLRLDLLVEELAHGALQRAVRVVVVGRTEGRVEPVGLGVGDGAELAGLQDRVGCGRGSVEAADLEAGVLGEDL